MNPINHIEERNGNYYLHYDTPDVSHCEKYTDKNSLIKAVASMVGVSILTSDEVDIKKLSKEMAKTEESTGWDTDPISHDGIQFNKHFIELKEAVLKLESKIRCFETFKQNICKLIVAFKGSADFRVPFLDRGGIIIKYMYDKINEIFEK